MSDSIPIRRANLATAFLTGVAVGVPMYLSRLITSPWFLVRFAIAMACLVYIALVVIFVHGPMVWTGWWFEASDGLYAPLPRMIAWLAGAGAACALLESAGLL